MNLPEIGTAAQFEALRGFLADSEYTQQRICEKLGLGSANNLDLITLTQALSEAVRAPGALNTAIRLFLLGESVSVAELESHIPGRAWAALNALGLIQEFPDDKSRCFSSVALYPVANLFIVSDRWSDPDYKPMKSFPDVVYPALTKGTREFLRFLPTTPCGEFLEVCGGSGIAALVASPYAQRTVSSDITERSTRFAEFNIRLNGVGNVSAIQGDMYGAVHGRTFDRIAAHPPYMPVLRPAEIYYDGGEDGEQLTRRIVEGLPQHLNRGGRLYCRTLATDRKESSFEKRVRRWLGDSENEFDIALFIAKNLQPAQFATDSAIRKGTGQTEVLQWKALFEKLEVQELLITVVVVQRRASERPVFTIRRSLSDDADSVATENVLRWETQAVDPRCAENILALAPVASTHTQLIVRHRLESGEFAPKDFNLTTDYPFLMDCPIQPWMGYLVSRCDGSRSIKQLFLECKEAGWIQPDTPAAAFASLVGTLVSGGFLSMG